MTTVLFFLSMFILLGLISSKVFEIKVRRIDFLSKVFSVGDQKIHNIKNIFIFKYNRYKKILNIFIFEFLPSYLYEILVKAKDYVARKYYEAGNNIRGKKMLKSNGSVSSFLEQLSEEKEEVKEENNNPVRNLELEKKDE